jgi:hypothetical protein
MLRQYMRTALARRLSAALLALFLAAPGAAPAWQELEPGLELGEFHAPDPGTSDDAIITVLRIDPGHFDFRVYMASEHGEPRTLDAWADDFGLVAAINASMYLPNHRTSTGLMRCGGHVNNGTINARFGSFLLSGPRREGLPEVRLVDRSFQDWRAALEDYSCAVQNYRIISLNGKNLWKPDNHAFSIAAVAQDHEGRVLLLHSRAPLSVHDFSANLLALPLDVRTAMYVEGGREAGLYVRSRLMTRAWSGGYSSFLFAPAAPGLHPLPNVIGVTRKPAEQSAAKAAAPAAAPATAADQPPVQPPDQAAD